MLRQDKETLLIVKVTFLFEVQEITDCVSCRLKITEVVTLRKKRFWKWSFAVVCPFCRSISFRLAPRERTERGRKKQFQQKFITHFKWLTEQVYKNKVQWHNRFSLNLRGNQDLCSWMENHQLAVLRNNPKALRAITSHIHKKAIDTRFC